MRIKFQCDPFGHTKSARCDNPECDYCIVMAISAALGAPDGRFVAHTTQFLEAFCFEKERRESLPSNICPSCGAVGYRFGEPGYCICSDLSSEDP